MIKNLLTLTALKQPVFGKFLVQRSLHYCKFWTMCVYYDKLQIHMIHICIKLGYSMVPGVWRTEMLGPLSSSREIEMQFLFFSSFYSLKKSRYAESLWKQCEVVSAFLSLSPPQEILEKFLHTCLPHSSKSLHNRPILYHLCTVMYPCFTRS